MKFLDRRQAGQQLAAKLLAYRHQPEVMVLALPRGGVPVGQEVATALGAPLDVFVVRKLGVPYHPEYAFGAIASGGVTVINPEAERLQLDAREVDAVVAREQQELLRRERLYRGGKPPLVLHDKTVILVDDGLATGATMRAAVRAVRQQGAGRVVVAVPVGAADTVQSIRAEVDDMVCIAMPSPFHAVGLWYEQFDQVSDDEVRAMLTAGDKREALT